MTALGSWEGATDLPRVSAGEPARPAQGEAVLSTWHHLLDNGSLQDGEPFLAGTAPQAVARISAATAQATGVAAGELLEVSTERGTITLPVELTPMPDYVVWVPTNSPGSAVRATLGVESGAIVRLGAGGAGGTHVGGAAGTSVGSSTLTGGQA